MHEAELLSVVNDGGEHFREVTAAEVVELARPVPHPDAPAAAALSATALRALYVTGLLAGRATPTPAQVATLGTAVLDIAEDLLSDGR